MTLGATRGASAGVMRASLTIATGGLVRTARTPSLLVQSLFFPTFFLVVYSGLYAAVVRLEGFPTDSVENWYVPFMMLQGGAFAGVNAGFGAGIAIQSGYFERQLLYPVPRISLMLGTILNTLARGLFVATFVLGVGLVLGARPTGGLVGFVLLYLAVSGVCVGAAGWALGLMYRAKDQRIAPLFPIGIFVTLFVSTAQVPIDIAQGWLQRVARINPITNVLRLARQSFLDSGVSWADTWGGLLAVAGMVVVLGWFGWSGLRKYVS